MALAWRLFTVSVALPLMVRVVLSAMALAFTVMVSPLPLALMLVLAVPVVMAMPLSPASPVFTVRVPLRVVALMSPTRLVTVWLAAPLWVSVVFWPRT